MSSYVKTKTVLYALVLSLRMISATFLRRLIVVI